MKRYWNDNLVVMEQTKRNSQICTSLILLVLFNCRLNILFDNHLIYFDMRDKILTLFLLDINVFSQFFLLFIITNAG